jgi:hypothetical protein
MSNEKEIIKKLFAIAKNQQKIIHKLAQQNTDVTVGDSKPHAPAAPSNTATPAGQIVHKDPATAIIQALGHFYTDALNGLSVNSIKNTVEVTFKPGKGTQSNYNYIVKTVQNLQNSNVLMGGPYKITAV